MSAQALGETGLATRRRQPAKIALASFIGTAIEWYDFFLFGTAASLVFNVQFFPTMSPTAGTLAAFGTFGAAFAARPIGGIIFGHFGDRIGRKRMLVLSLVIMGAGTFAIGLLPTYAQVGIWAPTLLVTARLLQGLAVGGEWGGAVLMAVEHAPANRRGFYGGWPQAGVPAGVVLSSSAFLLVEQLPDDQVASWGWRLPFLASIILVFVGLYVRLSVLESPDFRQVRESGSVAAFPILDVLRREKKPVLIGICTQAASNIPFYVVSVFVLSYAPKYIDVSRTLVLLCLIAASLIDIFTVPLVAALSDRWGKRNTLIVGSIYMALIAFPFFWLLDSGSPALILIAMVLAMTLGHALTYSAISSFLADLFDARLRYTGASLAYQVGGAVTSGPAPALAAALVAWAGGSWVISVYIIVACVITGIALWVARPRQESTLG